MNGGAGDDVIFGDGGDDLLIGGVGNDRLVGGAGSDTYIFNAGDGVDIIHDKDIKEVIIYDSVTSFFIDGSDAILQYGSGDSLSQIRFIGSSLGSIESLVVASSINRPNENNNVIILNSNSAQIIDGGDGDDLLVSLAEGDTLRGGAGRDYLLGGGGDDTLDGGTALYGADYLAGGTGNDTYQITANATDTYINNRDTDNGDDTIRVFGAVSASNAVISREADNLVIGFSNDTRRILVEDHFKGDSYAIDSIVFDDSSTLTSASILTQFSTNSNSSNILIATHQADQIVDQDGHDRYYGEGGADEFIDSAGNDTYFGGEGDDTYTFSSTGGVNTIVDSAGINVVNFSEDIAQEDLTFIRKFPNDLHISHANGQSVLIVQDFFEHHESAVSTFKFSTGEELTYRAVAELVMEVTEGDNYLVGSWSNDTLDGKGGNDLLAGAAGNDTLLGGDGLDELNGGSGNDKLTGGLDDDLLAGGEGDDTYYIALNDGNDVIEHQAGVVGQNVIVFSDDVDPAGITAYRDGGDLTLVRANSQTTTIKGYSDGEIYSVTAIEFKFGAGSQWSVTDINSLAVTATEESDVVFGDADENTIVALAGDDEVRGFAGNDTLSGGVGRDTLYGGDGDDTLNGNGDDDTLIGGAGNDILNGGDGEDDYYFSVSDGQDEIVDTDIGVLSFTSTVIGNYSTHGNFYSSDKYIISHGIESSVRLTRKEMLTVDHLLVAGERVDSILIESDDIADTLVYFSGDDVVYASDLVGDVNKIYMGDGENEFHLDENINGIFNVVGGVGADSFYLQNDSNISISGGGGADKYLVDRRSGYHLLRSDADDVIIVQEELGDVEFEFNLSGRNLDILLSDTLVGGVSNSVTRLADYFQSTDSTNIKFASGETLTQKDILDILLNGSEQSDALYGTAWADSIAGNGGDDRLFGKDGDDELSGGAGDDELYGGYGNDVLDGGAGNNTLQGDSGKNTYVVGSAGAQDTIKNFSSVDPYNLRDDVIKFSSDVFAEDVSLSRDANDLIITIDANLSSTIIEDFFSHLHVDGRYAINEFEFSNGQKWSFQYVVDQFGLSTLEDVFKGTDANDEIYGTPDADVINGGVGDDRIYAGSGANVVHGGANNDEISGRGELYGDGGEDVLTGTRSSGDKLYGGDGHDRLEDGKENYGGLGNDDIYLGGYRNNSITVGGKGDDTYFVSSGSAILDFSFSRGDGRDSFDTLGTGADIVLNFDETVDFDGVHLNAIANEHGNSGAFVRFELNYGDEDSVLFGAYNFLRGYNDIEFNFESNPSATLTIEELYAWSLVTTNESDTISLIESGTVDLKGGDDRLLGSSWEDDIRGGAGNDVLKGGGSKDIYRFGVGDGVDTVIDDQGDSTFVFDNSVNPDDLVLYRSNDDLIVDLPNNIITYQDYYGSNWSVFPALTLSFSDGQVLIPNEEFVELIGTGSDRDDNIELYDHPSFDYTVVGGLGDDVFFGSASSNTFLYSSGDGHDIIDLPISSVSNELIVSGVDVTDIVWSVDGYDLVIRDTVGLGAVRVNGYIGGGILNTINTPYVRPVFDSIKIGENVYSGDDVKELISTPSNENNFIFANGNEEDIEALGGNDWVIGTDSSDVIYGGDGEDVINGSGGDDIIYGEGDADIIYGSFGSDHMFGGDGDDILKADGDGNYFDGGAGNDTLIGRGEFVLYDGSGVDYVSDIFESKFIFENINYADVLFVRDIETYGTYDVTVEWNDGADAVVGVFLQDSLSRFRVQTLDFADRDLLSYNSTNFFRHAQITTHGVSKEFVSIMTGNAEDYWEINGVPESGLSNIDMDFSDVIYGGDANEIINSRNGSDTVYGGAGNDVINGGAGTDRLHGGLGDDKLNAGNYRLGSYGWVSGDSLTGGLGNDELTGSFTSDTYYFNIGDGYDVIYEDHSKNTDTDRLYFNGAITQDDLVFNVVHEDLVISYGVESEITIDSFFDSDLASVQLAEGSDQWRVVFESQSHVSYSLEGLLSLNSGDNVSPEVDVVISDQNINEDTAFTYTLPANTFSDADGDTLNLSATQADGSALPSWLNFDNTTATFNGTPANDNVGALDIRVTANDGNGGSVDDVFQLTITNTNDAPVTVGETESTVEDTPVVLSIADLLANDSDEDGDVLTISSVSNAVGGAAVLDSTGGTITFTPSAGYSGAASFDYTVADGNGAEVNATVNIAVTAQNDAPIVGAEIADQNADEDATFTYSLPANTFSDADGDTLTLSATLVDGSALPSWLNFDNTTATFSGTPANDNVGALDIRVTANDGNGGSVDDVFQLTITNTNDAPITVGESESTVEDTPVVLSIADLLANDSDEDGDVLSINSVSNSIGGIAVLDSLAGTVTFTPSASYSGAASFDYTVVDGNGAEVNATVNIEVTAQNDAPIVGTEIADQNADEDAIFTYTLPTNTFSDVDGDTLSLTATLADGSALPSWLSFDNSTATFSGTPANDNVGTLDIRVTANDGNGGSVDDVFQLTITNTNDAPVAVGESESTVEDTPVVLNIADLLANDSDEDGDVLTISSVSNAVGGVAVLDSIGGTITFTPPASYSGAASFDYTVVDGSGAEVNATVNIEVTAQNDAPIVGAEIADQNADEDATFTYSLPANTFSDADGDTLTLGATQADGSALPSWLNFDNTTATFSGTPANDNVGALDIRVTANDGNGGSVDDVFQLTITNTNDAPFGVDDSVETVEETPIVINVADLLSNDSDDDNDTLTIGAVTNSVGGLALFDAVAGTITFTPMAGYLGDGSFEYTLNDGNGGEGVASVHVNVNSAQTVLTIEAENYTRSYDLDPGNSGNAYSADDVDIQVTTDVGGGSNIGWTRVGEWLEYDLNLAEGNYLISSRIASNSNSGMYDIHMNGNFIASDNVSSTGGWQVWETHEIGEVFIEEGGVQTLRLDITGRDFNVNWLEFALIGNREPLAVNDIGFAVQDTATEFFVEDLLVNDLDEDGDALSVVQVSSVNGGTVMLDDIAGKITFTPNVGFVGSALFNYVVADGHGGETVAEVAVEVLPAEQPSSYLIEVENYTNYFDINPGNSGGVFREDDVDLEATTDVGGGYNLGWTRAGEWLEYEAYLRAGTYDLTSRVASSAQTGMYDVYLNDTLAATDSISSTGGWQTWESHNLGQLIVESDGLQTLRIEITGSEFNLNWLQLDYVPVVESQVSNLVNALAVADGSEAADIYIAPLQHNEVELVGAA